MSPRRANSGCSKAVFCFSSSSRPFDVHIDLEPEVFEREFEDEQEMAREYERKREFVFEKVVERGMIKNIVLQVKHEFCRLILRVIGRTKNFISGRVTRASVDTERDTYLNQYTSIGLILVE